MPSHMLQKPRKGMARTMQQARRRLANTREQANRDRRVPITLEFDFTNRYPAFGAAEIPKAPQGTPRIVINMAAILHAASENADVDWREATTETMLHEVYHVLQWALGKALHEGEVRAIERRLRAYRKRLAAK